MGISFVEYLNNYRLDAAAKMLLSSGENILNIASECGLDTPVVLSLIHISEPTRPLYISYAVFCLKKKKTHTT